MGKVVICHSLCLNLELWKLLFMLVVVKYNMLVFRKSQVYLSKVFDKIQNLNLNTVFNRKDNTGLGSSQGPGFSEGESWVYIGSWVLIVSWDLVGSWVVGLVFPVQRNNICRTYLEKSKIVRWKVNADLRISYTNVQLQQQVIHERLTQVQQKVTLSNDITITRSHLEIENMQRVITIKIHPENER